MRVSTQVTSFCKENTNQIFHSLNQLLKFVKLKGIELVSEVLTSILDNNYYSFKKNNVDEGSYFSLPKKSDVLMFKSQGLKLF